MTREDAYIFANALRNLGAVVKPRMDALGWHLALESKDGDKPYYAPSLGSAMALVHSGRVKRVPHDLPQLAIGE